MKWPHESLHNSFIMLVTGGTESAQSTASNRATSGLSCSHDSPCSGDAGRRVRDPNPRSKVGVDVNAQLCPYSSAEAMPSS